MKKHPPNFRICLIFLMLGIASVQPLKDSEDCDSDSGFCQKHSEENIVDECGGEGNHKSVFMDNHDCDERMERTADSPDSGDPNAGSCHRKESLEEEDEGELLMLGEQAKNRDSVKGCFLNREDISESSSNTEETEGATSQIKTNLVAESEEIQTEKDETDPTLAAHVESPDEAENSDQDPESENVPLQLREILLNLKPEGLTDNDDEQQGDFSVTEASMGEDGEVEEDIVVSSGSAEKQDAGIDNSSSDGNKNGSGGSGINKKAVCSEINTTEPVKDVEIINATMLMKLLQGNPNVTNRSSAGPCHLIYFFSPYCPFSVAGSPYVNAMARSLRNIPVYGLDSIEHHSVNARYGVMGTPTLLLFHNGNGVGRYNASEFSVAQLLAFVNHYTDQTVTDINVTSADFRASLPSQVKEGRPYALWASWVFLLSCAAWLFLTSELCARLTEAILNNWREAEAQNDQD